MHGSAAMFDCTLTAVTGMAALAMAITVTCRQECDQGCSDLLSSTVVAAMQAAQGTSPSGLLPDGLPWLQQASLLQAGGHPRCRAAPVAKRPAGAKDITKEFAHKNSTGPHFCHQQLCITAHTALSRGWRWHLVQGEWGFTESSFPVI